MAYEPVIGLEIHVQLSTKSKLFSSSSNRGEDAPPNTTINEYDLGHPGTLPVLNKAAVDAAVKAALALNCELTRHSFFDRKNYFYPDLPKGYQITQHEAPIGRSGWYPLEVAEGRERRIRITSLHIEEDAAKSIHEPAKGRSRIDFNRAGTPLIEIVTEPDFHDPAEVKLFLNELRLLVRYLRISDGDMEKGHLRCDANISLRKDGDDELRQKVEIKNLNSFHSVENALRYEVERQTALLDQGRNAVNETRAWDDRRRMTVTMRTKETASDYRYLPEPDLPPIELTPQKIEQLQIVTNELPYFKRKRFREQYGFSYADSWQLVDDEDIANFVEHVVSELRAWFTAESAKEAPIEWHKHKDAYAKVHANWLLNKFLPLLDEHHQTMTTMKVTAENFAEFVKLIVQKRLHAKAAGIVLERMVVTGGDPSAILEDLDLGSGMREEELGAVIDQVLMENVPSVNDYKAGKTRALQYLMGQVLKQTKGKADPEQLRSLLVHKLR